MKSELTTLRLSPADVGAGLSSTSFLRRSLDCWIVVLSVDHTASHIIVAITCDCISSTSAIMNAHYSVLLWSRGSLQTLLAAAFVVHWVDVVAATNLSDLDS